MEALLARLRELEQRLVALELDRRHDAERISDLERRVDHLNEDLVRLENPQ